MQPNKPKPVEENHSSNQSSRSSLRRASAPTNLSAQYFFDNQEEEKDYPPPNQSRTSLRRASAPANIYPPPASPFSQLYYSSGVLDQNRLNSMLSGPITSSRRPPLWVKDFVCEKCGRRFKNTDRGFQLGLIHEEICRPREFECAWCGQPLLHFDSLQKHLKTCKYIPNRVDKKKKK